MYGSSYQRRHPEGPPEHQWGVYKGQDHVPRNLNIEDQYDPWESYFGEKFNNQSEKSQGGFSNQGSYRQNQSAISSRNEFDQQDLNTGEQYDPWDSYLEETHDNQTLVSNQGSHSYEKQNQSAIPPGEGIDQQDLVTGEELKQIYLDGDELYQPDCYDVEEDNQSDSNNEDEETQWGLYKENTYRNTYKQTKTISKKELKATKKAMKPPWWNPTLNKLQVEVKKVRKRMQRRKYANKTKEYEDYHRRYSAILAKYRKQIKIAKGAFFLELYGHKYNPTKKKRWAARIKEKGLNQGNANGDDQIKGSVESPNKTQSEDAQIIIIEDSRNDQEAEAILIEDSKDDEAAVIVIEDV